jgi:hypothetical protein
MFEYKGRVAGTEGTENYVVLAANEIGLVAVRQVHGSTYRVRVQPATAAGAALVAETLKSGKGWKQPGDSGQFRFSIVVNDVARLSAMVTMAVQAIDAIPSAADFDPADASQAGCDFEGALAAIVMAGTTDHSELVARVHASSLPGRNFAYWWTTTSLMAKVSAINPADEHAALVAWVRKQKLPGSNFASRWSTTVLRRKVLDN